MTRRVFLQSAAAVSMLSGAVPSRKLLFSVNDISEYQGLPTGSVESHSLNTATGHPKLISRQSLSLSATNPKNLAVSPDGRFMVVAVFGGGLYNVLPISESGVIGPVTQVLKEIGHSVHSHQQLSAHPHSVAFHQSGNFVIGTDFGSDRINIFEFNDGFLQCVQRIRTPPGSGPARLTLSGSGSLVHVEFALSNSSSSYRFDPAKVRLSGI